MDQSAVFDVITRKLELLVTGEDLHFLRFLSNFDEHSS